MKVTIDKGQTNKSLRKSTAKNNPPEWPQLVFNNYQLTNTLLKNVGLFRHMYCPICDNSPEFNPLNTELNPICQ